jgi:hypothetical protein
MEYIIYILFILILTIWRARKAFHITNSPFISVINLLHNQIPGFYFELRYDHQLL